MAVLECCRQLQPENFPALARNLVDESGPVLAGKRTGGIAPIGAVRAAALDFPIDGDGERRAVERAAPYLLDGLGFSLQLTLSSFAGGLVLGVALALARHLRVPLLAPLATAYITLMRAIPLIMVLFWFFFLVPMLLMWATGAPRPVPVGPVYTAFITFAMFEAAYYAEIIRAGLNAVPKGQYEACRALSMSTAKTYWLDAARMEASLAELASK